MHSNEKIILTNEQTVKMKSELELFLKKGAYEKALKYYDILVSAGDTSSEREYAEILEEGVIVPENKERAMELYKRAALKNDARSAYKYSKYIMKESVNRGEFWLFYSALLGEEDAYLPTAKELSAVGREREANYFYTLASNCDSREATVALAKRYAEGIGFDKPNFSAGKWHLKKYRLLPVYAWQLAYKLKKIKAKEPPRVEFDETVFIRSLVRISLEIGAHTASVHLLEMLGKRGDLDALSSAGLLKIQYMGKDGGAEEGMKILRECALRGSSDAYITLGKLYRDGEYVKRDLNAAVFNYEMAGKAGRAEAYELLGDIYTDKNNGMQRDFARALSYYEKAGCLGSDKGKQRASEIILEREKIYKDASAATFENEKFRLYAIATAMGHPEATLKLAECYENGMGVSPDRVSAYNLYQKAAESGEAHAFIPLGKCYLNGIGINRDFKKALSAFIKAKRLGMPEANEYIKKVYEGKKRKLAKRAYSQAMRLVHKGKGGIAVELLALSKKLQYPKAVYSLGCLYEFGIGIPCDKDKAYAMYEEAFKLKFRDPRAKFKLSILRKVKAVL